MSSIKEKDPSMIEAEYEDVTPTEDLMKEHGILNRILLIYDEAIIRLYQNAPFQAHVVNDAANIVRDFIEDYHERQEEDHLFPRFKKANKSLELVNTLKEQHDVGRVITDTIIKLSSSFKQNDEGSKKELAYCLNIFTCMYRAHESREDTELFPQFRKLVTHQEFKELAEIFESSENERFGKGGYKIILGKVEELEKEFDIHNLALYTPQLIAKDKNCKDPNCLCGQK